MKIIPWCGSIKELTNEWVEENEENEENEEATGLIVDIVKADFVVPLINLKIPLPNFCLPKVTTLVGGYRYKSGFKMRISLDLALNFVTAFNTMPFHGALLQNLQEEVNIKIFAQIIRFIITTL